MLKEVFECDEEARSDDTGSGVGGGAVAVVADGAFAVRRDTNDGALTNGDDGDVNLVLALSGEEEVEFLVVAVSVVEAALQTARKSPLLLPRFSVEVRT